MRATCVIVTTAITLFSLAATANAPITPKEELTPRAEHKRATRLITHFLSNYHYKKPQLDDELSKKIFDRYIEMLDPTKSYLLRSDIDEFNIHRVEIRRLFTSLRSPTSLRHVHSLS